MGAGGHPKLRLAGVVELADDPQVQADGMMWDVEHSVTGPQKVVGPAVVMSRTPTAVQRAAPALGEHSAQILIEAGCPPEEVAKLCTEGVLVQR